MTQGLGSFVGGPGGGGTGLGATTYDSWNPATQTNSTPSSADPFGFGYGNPNGFNSEEVPFVSAVSTAAGQANNYNNMAGQVQNNQAPGIDNPYGAQSQAEIAGINNQQNAQVKGLQAAAANGQNSQQYKQYQQGVAQGQTAQTALGNSAGGGLASAGARRMTQNSNAMSLAGAQAGGQLAAQQGQQAAQNQIASTLGQQGNLQNQNYAAGSQAALQQAQLQAQQNGINNAGQLGYNSLSQNEGTQGLNALNGLANNTLSTEGVALGNQIVNYQNQQAYTGMALQGGTGLASAIGTGASNYNNQPNDPNNNGTGIYNTNPVSAGTGDN